MEDFSIEDVFPSSPSVPAITNQNTDQLRNLLGVHWVPLTPFYPLGLLFSPDLMSGLVRLVDELIIVLFARFWRGKHWCLISSSDRDVKVRSLISLKALALYR